MSGLISGIAGSLGGSSAKRDRSDYINANERMSNVFNNASGFGNALEKQGQATMASGTADLGTSGNFFRDLMSGNRAATTQAMAPQINAVEAQGDAQRRQQAALGTARGGGAAGVNQQAQNQRMAQIDNMLFGAQTGAAKEVGDIGRTEAGVGLSQTGQGLGFENLAENTAATQGEQAIQSRKLSEDIHQQHVKALSKSFENLLSGILPTSWLDKLSGFGMGGGSTGGTGGGGSTGGTGGAA